MTVGAFLYWWCISGMFSGVLLLLFLDSLEVETADLVRYLLETWFGWGIYLFVTALIAPVMICVLIETLFDKITKK